MAKEITQPPLPPGSYDFVIHDKRIWRTVVRDGDNQSWRRMRASFLCNDVEDYFSAYPSMVGAHFADLICWATSERLKFEMMIDTLRGAEVKARKRT